MSLLPGTRLGPYEILGSIGAGGMGEVYRAEDTRLSRLVAVKVLSSDAIEDPERRRRFRREAHAIAQLTHPHICSLFDVGGEDGVEFLVMELVEGDTLATKLQAVSGGGPAALDRTLPIADVLRYAVQIAAALAAAHRRGIVHRDLKPANVMLTRHGVKLLDFGIAQIGQAPAGASLEPTMSVATKPGVVLGTLHYMAPEQIEGRAVDARADIFAFGAMLYEMCTGRRPFEGATSASVIAATLTRQPAAMLAVAPAGRAVPADLDRLVAACLEKNPEHRWESAADLERELRWLFENIDESVTAPRPAGKPTARGSRIAYAGWVLAAAGLTAAAVAWTDRLRSSPPPASITQITVTTPAPIDFPDSWLQVAAAPDGRSIVFVGARDTVNILWIRTLEDDAPRPIDGTEDARSPFWSPDGRYIGFSAKGKLWKTTPAAGPIESIPIADVDNPINGSWTAGGEILFEDRATSSIYRVGARGGRPTLVVKPDSPDGWVMWPHALPDGRHFIYFDQGGLRGLATRGSYVASLDGGGKQRLLDAPSRVEYAAPGYLLFVRDGSLLAQPFDLERLAVQGDPVALAGEVHHFDPVGAAQFSASGGLLAYLSGQELSRVTWLDSTGLEIGALDTVQQIRHVNLSPDGARAAVDATDPRTGTEDLWIYDLQRNVAERITSTPQQENLPIWSPDGRRIAFTPDYGGPPTVWVRPAAAGSDRGEQVLPHSPRGSEGVRYVWSWSSDGRFIIYSEIDGRRNSSIWMIQPDGDRKPVQLLGGTSFHTEPALAPDGRWLAFASGLSGRLEIHVQRFPDGKGQRQLTTGGARRPRWARRGSDVVLYYASGTHLMSIRMNDKEERPGRALPVFRLPPGMVDYDVAPDGSQFLAAVPVSNRDALRFTVVQNWIAQLDRRGRVSSSQNPAAVR